MQDNMNHPHTPLPQPIQPPSQKTSSPTSNHFLPTTVLSIGSHTPGAQGSSTVPTLSPAEWYRLNQFYPFIQTMPFQRMIPMMNQDPPVIPSKRRGRPRKVRLNEKPSESSTSKSASTAEHDLISDGPTQTNDFIGQCWFTPHEDGRSDMDLVALWCSNFDNFAEWRNRPKHHAGEKLAIFIVDKGHPKRKGRECEKKVCHTLVHAVDD